MESLRSDDPLAVALMGAVRSGDLEALTVLLTEDPGLATTRIQDAGGVGRTPLHVATDWPAYFPHGPAVVRLLLDAGAAPNEGVTGTAHAETPLHWAASSDDLEVALALIVGGADVNMRGASIAGGGPLEDAVAYGCWHVARLLVTHGARVESLWQAAGLGLQGRVEEFLDGDPTPSRDEVDAAFWQACHGGQRRTAAFLLDRGADVNAVPGYSDRTPLDIAGGPDTRRELLGSWLRERGAVSATASSVWP